MDSLPSDIFAVASEFENKIRELNNTFRSHFEEMLNKPIEDDLEEDESRIPEIIQLKLRAQINDLYLYILDNYKKIPENRRIEIKYYSPSSDDYQEVLVFTAIFNVFSLYLRSLEDHELITDPEIIKFGNDILDNYRITSPD
ncbi:hypothetical protein SAMN05421813_1314 [Daejeonella rubra]|uniref:Uncharacterized protein n=1 Tax=Daejeonella rubra TaxID=990371 RepID=A0A1G9XJA5_9SPHI|nr:hypothetical protein [Daejeonella rubra]SDM96828.1 hypothetical protein SAMN05421813_1314 [Daejeonella rubra]